MFDQEEVNLSWFIANLFNFVTYVRRILKFLEQIPKLLISNASNDKTCPFF